MDSERASTNPGGNGSAAKSANLPTEGLVLSLKASQDGYTALIAAARNGHRHVVGFLLDHGAGMEVRDHVSCAPSLLELQGTTVCASRYRCDTTGSSLRHGTTTTAAAPTGTRLGAVQGVVGVPRRACRQERRNARPAFGVWVARGGGTRKLGDGAPSGDGGHVGVDCNWVR